MIDEQAVARQFEAMETEIETEKLKNQQLQNQFSQISMFSQNDASNLIQWQLDVSEEKEKIDHLLRGHVIKRDNQGNEFWDEPDDPMSKPLTDYGVEQLMNMINFYLSRNLILSNYDEETIRKKMKDIGNEIAGKMFLEYEYIFYQPKIKDLIKRDKKRIEELKGDCEGNIQKLAKLLNTLYAEYVDEMEKMRQKNLRHYFIIVRMLVDTIHSSYNRALNGGERESLRTARHVTQTESGAGSTIPGQNIQSTKQFKLFSPRTWAR